MEDTEWNDALKKFGIIKDDGKELEKLDEVVVDDNFLKLDDEDDQVIAEYRMKRLEEIRNSLMGPKFGDVREISAPDYVAQVNKAGENIWVVLLLFEHGIPLCTLFSQFFDQLASKFPYVKFLKSKASLCLANFPEANLPSIFVYINGNLKKQLVCNESFVGMNITCDGLEWILSETGAIKTSMTKDPRENKQSKKMFASSLLTGSCLDREDSDSEDD